MGRSYGRAHPHKLLIGPDLSCSSGRRMMQKDEQQASSSFQESLTLLEETFPFTKDQQLCHVGDIGVNVEQEPPATELLLSPTMPTCSSSLEVELQWQDVLAVIQPEDDSGESQALHQSHKHPEEENLKETNRQLKHGLEWPLLPLASTADLEDSLAFGAEEMFGMFPLQTPPTAGVTEEAASEGLHAMNSNISTHLLTEGLQEKWQSSPSLFCGEYDVNIPGHTSSLDVLSSNGFLGEDEDVLPSPLSDIFQDAAMLDQMTLLDLAMEEAFSPEMVGGLEDTSLDHEAGDLGHTTAMGKERDGTARKQQREGKNEQDNEADSDSGLSLDFSHGPPSPCTSESSSSSSSSYSSASSLRSPFCENKEEEFLASDMEVGVTIKQEELDVEDMGVIGEDKLFLPISWGKKCVSWLEKIIHDHSYNKKPWSMTSSTFMSSMIIKHTRSPQDGSDDTSKRSYFRHPCETRIRNRDEKRTQTQKLPFSNELIVNLPVEEFKELLENYRLSREQLTLVKDIRRRGKNKIAAQNCRKRKLDTLHGLEEEVSRLRRHRLRLRRENQEALRKLQERKRRLCILYHTVFSRLKDEEGRPLNATRHVLQFQPNGIGVATRQQEAGLPTSSNTTGKKLRNTKKLKHQIM
nr:endoplasmic reticulum membrane sensor NFE2L1-like isoform X2 [Doryrhamphus excisus]XP_057904098.1 endoplasmic reticulum membrane sensor NFE2L1-like isoform X2 [Doryrhamphus excisus]